MRFLFGIFGYDLTDNSYMRGYAYSMLNGKKLYLDLFSRLPPGGFSFAKMVLWNYWRILSNIYKPIIFLF